jgi:hypothetical protein
MVFIMEHRTLLMQLTQWWEPILVFCEGVHWLLKRSIAFYETFLNCEEENDQPFHVVLADTACRTFSCVSPGDASLLGPSGGMGGINPCDDFTNGRWVPQVFFLPVLSQSCN